MKSEEEIRKLLEKDCKAVRTCLDAGNILEARLIFMRVIVLNEVLEE